METEKIFLIPFGNDLLALTFEEFERAKCRAIKEGFAKREVMPLPETDEIIFTVEEAAKHFHVAGSTLYGMVREGRIPHLKIGGAVRFQKKKLMEKFNGK